MRDRRLHHVVYGHRRAASSRGLAGHRYVAADAGTGQAILNDRIPLSIGGGIGQARTFMYLLRTAHLGEVTVSVWPQQLKDICTKKNIHVLE